MQQDSREVELRAQSNENSQLFMDSQFSSNFGGGGGGGANSLNHHSNRFTALENVGSQSNYYDSTSGPGGIVSQQNKPNRVTVNLEDAVLEEQKLYQILEALHTCFHIVNISLEYSGRKSSKIELTSNIDILWVALRVLLI